MCWSLGDVDKLDVDTPALLIDLSAMERNIFRMARYFQGKRACLRPHIKTHKTPIIAHKQMEAGAKGITCQKLGEAEAMVAAGIRDVLISNQVVGKAKIERLVNLVRHGDITVAVDDPINVEELSEAALRKGVKLNVLVEVNVGMNRCGVEPGRPALRLAQKVVESKGLNFRGLMGYEGHCVFIEDFEKRRAECQKANELLVGTKNTIEDAGIDVDVVSAGGTGTYNITGENPDITEVQAGSYVTMDTKYRSVEGIGDTFECALTVLTTVLSKPTESRAVVDAGMKAMTMEFGTPQPKDVEGIELISLSEEHGKLRLDAPSREIKVGEKLEFIPSHGCTTINLHDKFYGVRNGEVEAVWEIAARGRSQ